MQTLKLVPLGLPALLAACATAPDYETPTMRMASGFSETAATPAGDVTTQQWWLQLNDPMLNQLVKAGMAQNLDIRTALARVAQAQAAARASGLPAYINGSVNGSYTRSGGEVLDTTDSRSASFGPSVVIDLFGAQAYTREAALASLQSAELSVGEARLAFLSSLVSTYLDLRYYQQAMALTRQTIASQSETLSLARNRAAAGAATSLEVAQAEAAYEQARAQLPGLESGYYASLYAIATLLAVPVQEIQGPLQTGGGQPLPRGASNPGVPADLLRNRPDVRAAERDYAAAVAGVGVSTAQLYPSLTLAGTVTATGTNTWGFGPTLSIPVLNRPSLLAARDQSKAQAEQARLAWQASVLGAVEDVQSAQSAYLRSLREVSSLRSSVNAYTRVTDLSQQTYEGGTTTLSDLLDGQRSLASARLSLAASVRDMAANWASLQVSAGRGWATGPAVSG